MGRLATFTSDTDRKNPEARRRGARIRKLDSNSMSSTQRACSTQLFGKRGLAQRKGRGLAPKEGLLTV